MSMANLTSIPVYVAQNMPITSHMTHLIGWTFWQNQQSMNTERKVSEIYIMGRQLYLRKCAWICLGSGVHFIAVSMYYNVVQNVLESMNAAFVHATHINLILSIHVLIRMSLNWIILSSKWFGVVVAESKPRCTLISFKVASSLTALFAFPSESLSMEH